MYIRTRMGKRGLERDEAVYLLRTFRHLFPDYFNFGMDPDGILPMREVLLGRLDIKWSDKKGLYVLCNMPLKRRALFLKFADSVRHALNGVDDKSTKAIDVIRLIESAKVAREFSKIEASVNKSIELRERQEGITKNSAKLKVLIERAASTFEIVFIHNGRLIQACNSKLFSIFGYTEAELKSKYIMRLLFPDSFDCIPEEGVAKVVGVRKDGIRINMEVDVLPITYFDGSPALLTGLKGLFFGR